MAIGQSKIFWTKVDEAPALAMYSFLPIVCAYLKGSGITVEVKDISLAGRILANFPEALKESQRVPDSLAELGELSLHHEANIIKQPNISASVPQLKEAIRELQQQGHVLPDYPENPASDEEKAIKARYAKVLGSAVNPVLREGNSDRRAPLSVKNYAKKHPHKLGSWTKDSKARVAHMEGGDFYGNEKSVAINRQGNLRIEFVGADGQIAVLKEKLSVQKEEIVDATFMSKEALRRFYADQMNGASDDNLLFSLHLKATMMKVSDPVLFGHALSVYFEDVFKKHAEDFEALCINPDLGLGDLYVKIQHLSAEKQAEICRDIEAAFLKRPALAMVDSIKGITNLHVPSDVIVDASMPAMIRDSGRMFNKDRQLQEALAVIPDRCYSTIYAEVIDDCKKNGAFDPATMGTVQNVGLMAQQAEEYGSHPTTFIIPTDGSVRVLDDLNQVLMEHEVNEGDIWRMSRVKDIPVKDWVRLAVIRARATGFPAIFWLDRNRPHDAQVIAKVERYLKDHDAQGLDIRILPPVEAMKATLERLRKGQDTIAVTGNVLRDYLTDLFPILELGTSAKMLSIVPLLAGGGLFETGAGGSAPKHVQQFIEENYLRWDSLGEFSALAASLEHLAFIFKNKKAEVFGQTLDQAIAKFLDNNKSPTRKVGGIDNRGSHFYLALYWAEALARQDEDQELKTRFAKIRQQLCDNEDKINAELIEMQGHPVDLEGYYYPDPVKVSKAMRPSQAFNAIIDSM